MDNQRNSHEAQWMEALSMGMYGRPTQNRCSILNHDQREKLRTAAMEMMQDNGQIAKADHSMSEPLNYND